VFDATSSPLDAFVYSFYFSHVFSCFSCPETRYELKGLLFAMVCVEGGAADVAGENAE
jgi:hypothetical protein